MTADAQRELQLNLAATDIDKQVNLSRENLNWLQERLRKLAHDLEMPPEPGGAQGSGSHVRAALAQNASETERES